VYRVSRIVDERRRKREEVLNRLKEYARALRKAYGRVTLILYGSYARGDFNVWSDIDVIVVSHVFEKAKFTQRWRLLPEPPEGLEALDVITWTPDEARKMLSKPSWKKALEHSITIADDHGLLRRTARTQPP